VRRGLAILSFGHLATDACQGAVPALLPFLIASRGFTVAQASLLVLAATAASSVLQPVFGVVSDRRSLPWLMPLGPLIGALGVAAVGLTSSFPATFTVIVVSGIGVAAFHPEGSRYANYISRSRPATGMSLFSVGGNAGFAVGPALVALLVVPLGLSGVLGFLVLGLIAAAVLTSQLSYLRAHRPVQRPARADTGADQWAAFVRLSLAVVCRSGVYFGLLTFVPLWFTRHLHTGKAVADAALSAMLLAGAVGTLVGGRLGDRLGPRQVFIASMAPLPVLIAAFVLVGSPLLAGCLLAVIGAATIATFSTTVVIGQRLLPGHLGVASGVTLGLAIGMGGVIAAGLGAIADSVGLTTVLALVAVMPVPALALAGSLPRASQAPGHHPRRSLAVTATPSA